MTRRTIVVGVLAAILASGCQSPEARARAAFRQRLKQDSPLSHAELAQFFDQIAPVLAHKTLKAKQGAVIRELTPLQRDEVLGTLTDPAAVYDAGLRTEGRSTWRGIRAGATPPTSEIDAMATLWIDIDTFLPARYEFAYSMPGLGDYSYDLTFE